MSREPPHPVPSSGPSEVRAVRGLEQLVAETIVNLLHPLRAALDDPDISEIMINGPDLIFIERHGAITPLAARFASAHDLEAAARSIVQFAGKRLSADDMSIEARLPDGSRVHIMQPPAARGGLCMAIRRFHKSQRTLASLVAGGSLTDEAADFLTACVAAHKNILVSGGTGTGKTTLLGALSAAFDDAERILVIEDVKELDIAKPHILYLEAQRPDRFGQGGISVRELFRGALRMRPDRIIVGECRGGEALDMIQAMTSGHTGSLSTLHANDPRAALQRLETMALMSDIDLPLGPLRAQIVSAIDLVVQIARQHGHRIVTEISEIDGLDDGGRFVVRPLYRLRQRDDDGRHLMWTGHRPRFADEVTLVYPDRVAGPSRSVWAAPEL